MKKAAEDYEVAAWDLALLEDRLLTHQNKPQIYGSQLRGSVDGKYELFPIEDETNVDIRRARVGLQPIRDYMKYFNIDYIPKR